MNPSILLFILNMACRSDKGVTVFNATPEAQITSHSDGTVLDEGYLISFRGTVTDANHSYEQLEASWYADQSLLCDGIVPASDGLVQCDATVPTAVTAIRLEVQDPQNATGLSEITVSVTPTDAPVASITEPVSTGVFYSDQLITFEGTLSDSEDAPEMLSGFWESGLDGILNDIAVEPDSEGLVSGFGYLSEGEHALQLHVEDSTGKTHSDSVVIVVGPPNTAPSCDIISPLSNSAGAFGELLQLQATVSDPDVAADWLNVTWSSDKDGALGASTPSSSGEVLFSLDTLSVNTHTISMTVVDEVGASCTDLLSYTVGTPPSLSIITPTPNALYSENQSIAFDVSVADNEDLATDIALEWLLDGQLYSTQGADSTGTAQFVDSNLAVGSHNLTVRATDTDGLYQAQSVSFVVDGLPTAPNCSISPNAPQTNDDLQASASGSVDPEGAPVSYAFEWLQNGQNTSYASASLPASATLKNEIWTVRVTPNDGNSDGPFTEVSTTIVNTPPVISALSISPSSPSTESVMSCTPQSSDADGDALNVDILWENLSTNSSLGAGSTLVLSPSTVQPGDILRCTVTLDDGDGGQDSDSALVTIDNTPPTVLSVSLAPSAVQTNDTLTVSAIFEDLDGQNVTASYDWHVVDASNGNVDLLVQSGSVNTLSGLSFFDRDDTVYVVVTPNDGSVDGSPLSSSLIGVQNTAPEAAEISLSPEPAILGVDDLVCTIDVPANDDDGDALLYTYDWEAPDGSIVQSTGPSSQMSDTLTSSHLTEGEWICHVSAEDDTLSGPSISATSLVEGGCHSVGFQAVSYIDFGAASALMQPNQALTVELWTRWDGQWVGGSNYAPVLIGNIASNSGGGWNVALEQGGYWNVGARTTGNNLAIGAGLAAAEAEGNRWTHVVAQFESSNTGSSLELFVNGTAVGVTSSSNPLYFAGNELLTLGNQPDHYDALRQFTGEVASLRISNVHRYSGSFIPDSILTVDSDTLGLWTFSEGSGSETFGQGNAPTAGQLVSAGWSETCPSEDADSDGLQAWQDCDDGDGVDSYWGSGESADCPADSCLDILEAGHSLGDGGYWIDPTSSGSFEVWCDMSTDGGGWTQVARGIGGQHSGWATTGALNPTGFDDFSQTFKLSDTQINAIDRSVIRFSGENSVLASWYWDGACVYNHTGLSTGLCNCTHDTVDLTGISWCGNTHPEHLGIGDWSGGTVYIDGYGYSNTHGYLHTNTGGGRNYWYMRELWADEDGTRCEGYMSGCDIGLYVR